MASEEFGSSSLVVRDPITNEHERPDKLWKLPHLFHKRSQHTLSRMRSPAAHLWWTRV